MTNILQGDEHHPTTVRVSTHDVTHAGHHESLPSRQNLYSGKRLVLYFFKFGCGYGFFSFF